MPLEMPSSFWGSTVVLVAISFLLHLAVVNVRQEKQLQFFGEVNLYLSEEEPTKKLQKLKL